MEILNDVLIKHSLDNEMYDDELELEDEIDDLDLMDSDVETNKSTTKNGNNQDKKSFDYFEASYLEEGEVPLAKVIGHESQKTELLNFINWFKKSKELKSKGVSIPRGIILFGSYGNGKSLIMKEMIRCAEAPVFVFQGEQDNIVDGIISVFKKARESGHAIIIFDELDLLINKDRRVIRALQENLDGVESSDDILVLAATNNLRDIPEALMRNGRLEKIVRIPFPTGKEAVQILKSYLDTFHITYSDELDEDELEISLTRISCAGIKAIANDIVLRNGFKNITNEMVYASIFNITDRITDAKAEDRYEVAIHEAAHAFVASTFPKHFQLNRLNISGASGEFHAKEIEKDYWPYDKVIADIKICMAGNLAQKVICGQASRGCESDLENARMDAYNIINKCGYHKCWETLPEVRDGTRTETPKKRRHNEVLIERMLRKCEKETLKIIKNNKTKIIMLGKLLQEKKHLKSSEIYEVINK